MNRTKRENDKKKKDMNKQGVILRHQKLLRLISDSTESPNGMTLEMLAEELNVSTRTVNRYLDTLENAGYPLQWETDNKKNKWWKIHAQPPRFSYYEVAMLYLGQCLLQPLQGTLLGRESQSVMEKIRKYLGTRATENLHRLLAVMRYANDGWSNYEAKAEFIDMLLTGCETQQQVEITYLAASAETPATYRIHPYAFRYSHGALYLIGLSPKRDIPCMWKLDRLHAATLTNDSFTIPDTFDLDAFCDSMFGVFPTTNLPETIRIRISSSPAARRAYEHHWHPSQKNYPQPDGSHIIEFNLPITPDFKFWLLSFGHRAEVLEPLELRDVLCKEAAALQNVYNP